MQRFENDRTLDDKLGPGNYTDNANGFNQRSFNRKQQDGYIGNRMTRFDQSEIRPKIGPGTYNPGYETVKETKIKNIFL